MIKDNDFYHLHVHDQYSLLDGYGTAQQYAEFAKELGQTGIALTNHGNVDGVLRWQEACKEASLKCIIGCEAYIVPDLRQKVKKEKRYHINLLCKDMTGFKNVMKMLSVANMEGFYYRPRIDPELLVEHLDGLVVGTACLVSFINMPDGIDLLKELARRTEVFVEVMPHAMPEQVKFNQHCLKVAKDLKLPIIATNDCHYVKKEQSLLQEVLLAMQAKRKWNDPKRWKFDIDTLWLTTVAEMRQMFEKQGVVTGAALNRAMAATKDFANLCNLTVKQQPVALPKPKIKGYEHIKDEGQQLIQITVDGYYRRREKHDWITADNEPQYLERIEEELDLIINLGFARYFLIVFELINWCRDNDVMVGPGRGSTGGSLVAFCLNIVQTDPIKLDLVFSRFISEGRIDLPDIDMDFEDRKRDRVLKHLKDEYGEHNVVGLSTFAQLRGRGALRDVARVFEVPIVDVNKAASCIVTRSLGDARADFGIADAFDAFEDGKAFQAKYPEVSRIAMAMEGQVRGCGKHAAAMCVSKNDMMDGVEGYYAVRSKDSTVCNWDKVDAEYMGLMKLDVLGLNALTILSEAQKLIKERQGVDIDYESLPMDDPKVYEQFSLGNGVGVFQFNSPGMMRICREIGVEDFEALTDMNALHRPGTLRSGLVSVYNKRKHGEEQVTYAHPFIEEITKTTQGIILYQEQVMRLMFDLGGLPWKTADMIRKVISKRKGEEQFMSFKQMFIDGCEKRKTVSRSEAEVIFNELQYFGSYGFNKSHAAEYAMIAYWEMWLKVYYPVEYMLSILTFGNPQKKADHIDEARRLGLKLLLPDINQSLSREWTADEDGNLLIPFEEIKGVGPTAGREIVRVRDGASGGRITDIVTGPFKDFDDFEERVNKTKVNIRVRKLLAECMCFDDAECKGDLDEARLDGLSQYFNFSLSNDPMYKYRKMIRKVGTQINIEPLSVVGTGWGGDTDSSHYHFGVMDILKFGFKERGDGKTMREVRGTAGDLGGVYGNFKDDTDYIMLVFGSKFYQQRKYDIEHSEGKWLLVNARKSGKASNIFTDALWFGDELLAGGAEGLGLEFMQPAVYPKKLLSSNGLFLHACEDCVLRKECRQPVYPSLGQMNMMIIGEAPGRDEDRLGKGFVGDSGDLLWNGGRGFEGMVHYGLKRELFHVTNICKCWPSQTKTPKKIHLAKCSKYLDAEIAAVKPFVILAFGNTALKFFKEQESGIMQMSGVTEWSDKYECWICYSMHPAALIYHQENLEYLQRGISNFAEKISILGLGD